MQQLRLLSYNIEAGIYTRQYREYVTKSWRHILPHREHLHNLSRIASVLHGFDFVGLQEVTRAVCAAVLSIKPSIWLTTLGFPIGTSRSTVTWEGSHGTAMGS